MKMKKILQKEEKILRKTAALVPISDIKKPKIQKILVKMTQALGSQHDGVAIAAPQIGYSLRIFVVSGKVFNKNFTDEKNIEKENGVDRGRKDLERDGNVKKLKNMVFINPVISKLSREKEWVPEGCLSVRPLYGKTFRSKKATVTAYDENGGKFVRGASGLLAQIFQHETDHLNGILFIDHAKDVREEKTQELKK